MSLQRLRIGEDTDGLYRAIDAVGRAEYSYFGTWSPFLRRTPHGVVCVQLVVAGLVTMIFRV